MARPALMSDASGGDIFRQKMDFRLTAFSVPEISRGERGTREGQRPFCRRPEGELTCA
jgi:hypothetical protein